MARVYEILKKRGVIKKAFEHPDIEFVTNKGKKVVLKWERCEYRTYKILSDERPSDMRLGATAPENLQKYITERW